jgi:WD40 repeat protein
VTTDLRLEKYDVASRKLVGSVADIHRGDCHALAVSGDGALVATGGSDRLVKVSDVKYVKEPR